MGLLEPLPPPLIRQRREQALTWGDLDFEDSRLRVRRGKTRAARRWVACPDWLMDEIGKTLPRDDRTPERRVFIGATRQVLGMAMRKAFPSDTATRV